MKLELENFILGLLDSGRNSQITRNSPPSRALEPKPNPSTAESAEHDLARAAAGSVPRNGVPLQGTDPRNPNSPRSPGSPPPAMLTRLPLLPAGPEQAVGVQGPAVPWDAGGVRGGAAGFDDGLHREHVLLHHGGAGLRALLPRRRDQEDHHGARQEHQDPLRLLLRTVRASSPSCILRTLHFISSLF